MIFFGTPHTALSTKVEDSLFAKMAELNDIDPKTLNLAELNQISEQFLEESVKATDVKFVSFYEKGTGSSHSKIVGRNPDVRRMQAHEPFAGRRSIRCNAWPKHTTATAIGPSRHERL
jgi:hypothetical protein